MTGLVERLLAVESGAPDFIGDTDPHRCRTMWHRNPDGPEAAARIKVLEEALERIAGMTDIEADFDGFEARQIAEDALRQTPPGDIK